MEDAQVTVVKTKGDSSQGIFPSDFPAAEVTPGED